MPLPQMLKRQVFLDHKASVLGVALNRVPRNKHALFTQQLKEMLEAKGTPFAGGMPEDPLLAKCRLVAHHVVHMHSAVANKLLCMNAHYGLISWLCGAGWTRWSTT